MAFNRIHTDARESGAARRSAPPILQQLEPRLLLSGVTLITHGHIGSVSGWINGMSDAIADRIAEDSAEYTLVLNEGPGHKPDSHTLLADDPQQTYDTVASGQAIVKLDWSEMTAGLFDFDTSTTDVGYYVADWLAAGEFAQMPIHLIGHSRGGSVISAIARKLAEHGIWVDHVTTLDPHPIGGDAAVNTYDNVRFADNYWRTGSWDPDGQPVAGSYDRELNESELDGWFNDPGYSGGHSDVHLWYHGTIDDSGDFDDTETGLNASEAAEWYDPANDMPGPRDHTGFHYSLIAGGDRSELVGWGPSAANRTYVTRSGAQWSNLESTLQFTGLSTVTQGDAIGLSYRYQAAIASDISFGFDTDRNPYNASPPQYADTIAMPATSAGGAFDNGIAETHDADTSQISPGSYYIVARITADGRVRYAYSAQQVTIDPAPLLGDADGSGTVDDADIEIFAAEFGMRGTNLAADFDTDGYVGLADFVILREHFGSSLPAASPVAAPGLVTLVNQSTPQTAPAIPPTSPQPPASTNKSVVGARQPQSIAASVPPQTIAASVPLQSVNSEQSSLAEPRHRVPSPSVDRKLTGVLSSRGPDIFLDSDDLLADVLAESALAKFY